MFQDQQHTDTQRSPLSDLKAPSNWKESVDSTLTDFSYAIALLEEYYPYPELSKINFEYAMFSILMHVTTLRLHFPDLSAVKGLRILDLACGARNCRDNYSENGLEVTFDPWASRLLHRFGAEVVGVDICKQENEKFQSYVADLTEPDALNFLEAGSFDACMIMGFPPARVIQSLFAKNSDWATCKENLNSHMLRCLKPSGVIIHGLTEDTDQYVEETIQKLCLISTKEP